MQFALDEDGARIEARRRFAAKCPICGDPVRPAEIAARERFYRRMAWLLNAEAFASRFLLLRVMGERIISFRSPVPTFSAPWASRSDSKAARRR